MRIIKFRAWDKANKHMFYGIEDNWRLPPRAPDDFGEVLGCDEFEVMQFTGLVDSKGAYIYEGDILQWNGGIYEELDGTAVSQTQIDLVVFKNGSFVATSEGNLDENLYEYLELDGGIEETIVIGNIFENKELLEGEKQ